MKRFRCGDVTVSVDFREVNNSHVLYRYRVELDGAIIVEGDELGVPHNRAGYANAANEILSFLIYAGDDTRAEFGWTFDAEVLFDRLNVADEHGDKFELVEVIE